MNKTLAINLMANMERRGWWIGWSGACREIDIMADIAAAVERIEAKLGN